MKRITLLICAVSVVAILLCACSKMMDSLNGTDQRPTDAPTNSTDVTREYPSGYDGAFDENRADTRATDVTAPSEDDTDGIYTEDGNLTETIEERFDDMVEDGKVEDGDGNVGEAENHDGDMNIDYDAVDETEE